MDINTRSRGLVDNLNQFNYHILGCGAIGSATAIQLARMGAEDFALYDMDKVETPNIGVSQYNTDDIGKQKVSALGDKLFKINSNCEIVMQNELFNNYIYMK